MSVNLGQSPLVIYNWNPSTQLTAYLVAQAAVAAGISGSTATIVALGDSTTVGIGDDNTGMNLRNGASYPNDLTQDLVANGVPAQSDNFLGGLMGEDPRITLIGDAHWSGVSVPGSQAVATQSAESGLEFKLTSPGSYNVFNLDYVDVGTGIITVSVDGEPPTTIQLQNTQQIVTQAIELPLGKHSEVTVLSTTSTPVYLSGGAFENTAAPAVEVYNAGSQGSGSSVINQDAIIDGVSYAGIGQLQGVAELKPNLVLIDYGINDINNGVTTPAQTAANIAQAVIALRNNGSESIIVIPEPFLSPYYAADLPMLRADLQGVSIALNVPIIDLSATFGNSFAAVSAAGLAADRLHPNATAYADIAADYAKLLTSETSSGETLSVTGSTLVAQSGIRFTLTGSSNSVTAGYGSLIDVVGDDNQITASSGDTVNVAGNATMVTSADGIAVNLEGNGASVTAGASSVQVHIGTGEIINVSDSVVVLQDGTGALLTGAGNTVMAGYYTLVGVVGDGNQITASAGDTVNVVGNDAVIASADGIAVNLEGNGASVTAGVSSVQVHIGTGEIINVSDSVVVLQDGTGALLTGAGNTVTTGYYALVGVVGDGNQVTASAGDTVNMVGNDAVIASADGIVVNLEGNGASVIAGASSVQVHIGTGEAINVSDSVVLLQDGTGATVSGSENNISLGLDAYASVHGSGNVVHCSSSLNQDVGPVPTSISVYDDANMIFLGSGSAKVSDTSSNLTLVLSGLQPLSRDAITNFGAQRGAMFDLVGGAGGYTTGLAAFQALKSDGQGGSLLQIGDASVDFVSLAPTMLTAANFRVS